MKKFLLPLLIAVPLASTHIAMADTAPAFKPALSAEKINDNIEVITIGDNRVHTFYGISNSHLIETPNSLTLVDMQFIKPQANKLREYIDSLNKPIDRIILSHAHPDHWFGYTQFEGTVWTTPKVKEHLDQRGAEFIKAMQGRFDDRGGVPETVVTVNTDLEMGAQNWDGLDVILEEYTNQESHASVAIKIPEHGIIIGQDLFYNGTHMVASNLERNKNWIKILEKMITDETATYSTYLVGHGRNSNAEFLSKDIEYLTVLDEIVTSGVSKEEAKQQLIDRFPDLNPKTKGFIDITLRNLYDPNHH